MCKYRIRRCLRLFEPIPAVERERQRARVPSSLESDRRCVCGSWLLAEKRHPNLRTCAVLECTVRHTVCHVTVTTQLIQTRFSMLNERNTSARGTGWFHLLPTPSPTGQNLCPHSSHSQRRTATYRDAGGCPGRIVRQYVRVDISSRSSMHVSWNPSPAAGSRDG